MTREEFTKRVTSIKEQIAEKDQKINNLEQQIVNFSNKLTATKDKINSIKSNSLYNLLPNWTKSLIESIFESVQT